MKHTIIECDLCNGRICKDGYFMENGAVKLRMKVVTEVPAAFPASYEKYSKWERRTIYICPKCVDKIKGICKGGEADEEA